MRMVWRVCSLCRESCEERSARASKRLDRRSRDALEHPNERRFRTARLLNVPFHHKQGRFEAGSKILRSLGFEDGRNRRWGLRCLSLTYTSSRKDLCL